MDWQQHRHECGFHNSTALYFLPLFHSCMYSSESDAIICTIMYVAVNYGGLLSSLACSQYSQLSGVTERKVGSLALSLNRAVKCELSVCVCGYHICQGRYTQKIEREPHTSVNSADHC